MRASSVPSDVKEDVKYNYRQKGLGQKKGGWMR